MVRNTTNNGIIKFTYNYNTNLDIYNFEIECGVNIILNNVKISKIAKLTESIKYKFIDVEDLISGNVTIIEIFNNKLIYNVTSYKNKNDIEDLTKKTIINHIINFNIETQNKLLLECFDTIYKKYVQKKSYPHITYDIDIKSFTYKLGNKLNEYYIGVNGNECEFNFGKLELYKITKSNDIVKFKFYSDYNFRAGNNIISNNVTFEIKNNILIRRCNCYYNKNKKKICKVTDMGAYNINKNQNVIKFFDMLFEEFTKKI